MPTNYTGAAGNVSLATAAQISEVADGDADAAASFTPAFQKLTDYIEALRTRPTSWAEVDCSGGAGAVVTVVNGTWNYLPVDATNIAINSGGGAITATRDTALTGGGYGTPKFTIGTGQGGTYLYTVSAALLCTSQTNQIRIVKNNVISNANLLGASGIAGSVGGIASTDAISAGARQQLTVSGIAVLAAGDFIAVQAILGTGGTSLSVAPLQIVLVKLM